MLLKRYNHIIVFVSVILLLTGNFLFAQNPDTNIETIKSVFLKQNYVGKTIVLDTIYINKKTILWDLYSDQIEQIKLDAKAKNNEAVLDKIYKVEGEVYYDKNNYSKAIPVFIDLLATKKIKNYKDSALILHYLKKSYVHIHALNKAVEIHYILEKIKHKHPGIDVWLFHPLLSNIYYEMKLYKECLDQQLLEYKDYFTQTNSLLINYYNNRGLFWNKYGNQDSALWCFKKARNIFETNHLNQKLTADDEFVLGFIEGNMAFVYVELKEYHKAIALLKKDIRSSINTKHFLSASNSEISLAECYIKLNNLQEAFKFLEIANQRLKTIDDYRARLKLLQQYSAYYEKTGDYKKSNDCYKKYINLKDSTEEAQNLQDLITAEVANQVQLKENLIKENQLKINEKSIEVNKQRTIQKFLLIIGFILIVVIIVIGTQLKRVNRHKKLLELKNKKIKTRNSIINKALLEKDLLIKEIHHRVKNNLQIVSSLLKLQTGKTNNPEILNSLNDAQDRINSMAILHQLLYKKNQMTNLSLKDYLSNLIWQISNSSSSTKNITIQSKLIELETDIDTAIPLGLITNELMSNAYKHAFKNKESGIISIELVQIKDKKYSLKIFDNGSGIPADFDLSSVESLGMDIVSILCEQINAELKIHNDNGAHFEVVFKLT